MNIKQTGVGVHGEAPETAVSSVREQVTARHNRWVWLNVLLIACACVIGLAFGAEWGAFWIAGVLVVDGAVRLVLPEPGPAGLTIRSRYTDVAMFWGSAGAIAFLAATAPLV